MHRRRLLRRREQPADLRDGEDRIAGLHGSADTHLRPSLKTDDQILNVARNSREETDSTTVLFVTILFVGIAVIPSSRSQRMRMNDAQQPFPFPPEGETASMTELRGSAYGLGRDPTS